MNPICVSVAALAAALTPLPALAQMEGMDHSGHASPSSAAEHSHDHHAAPSSQPEWDCVASPYVEGSGTARLPGGEGGSSGACAGEAHRSHSGLHFMPGGDWMLMLHGYVWGVHTNQGGPRGDDKTYVQSMAMFIAEKPTGWGRLQLRTMFSAEPLMNRRGYPNLFATGETAYGRALIDRQHPHDLFMELAARVDVKLGQDTSVFLYGGPVGEPSVGPTAFMMRSSARYNPEAPISHHWFDATHITYGVVTAGLSAPKWQIEASAFRGAEPDEARWGIESPRLDSWSVRATFNPSPTWSMQLSHAFIKQPETLHPGENERRTTASVHYADRRLSAMAAFSAKNRSPGATLTAWLVEANWNPAGGHNLFGRVENVKNDELFPGGHPLHDVPFRVTKLQAGYAYRIPIGDSVGLALGGSASTFIKPAALDSAYGRRPMGYSLFARLSLGQ